MTMASQSDYASFPSKNPMPHNSRGVWDWFKVETGLSADALTTFGGDSVGQLGQNDDQVEVYNDMAGAIRMMHPDTGAATVYATIFFDSEQARAQLQALAARP